MSKGDSTKTKGYLKGDQGWSKYKIEVQGGSYSNGKIKIAKSTQYHKGDSLTVSVYTRKWFLGGSGNPPGNNGLSGMSGRDGFDGAPGQKGKVVFTAI
jgi:hypothetical protein